MLRLAKGIFWLAVLGLGVQCASAFSLLGPAPAGGSNPDGYQQPVIGYNLGGDIGTPKNLGEEYRWNTPTLYYAYDTAFLDYFGSNGVVAIEQAIAIMNGLTNFSTYSQELYEIPLEATKFNYRAQALNLLDLKTTALSFLAEELGLADSERFTWCLRDRRPIAGLSCPFMVYNVIKRNFDPATFEPSSYVNGTLFSYNIVEFCTGPDPLADAVEFAVDPLALTSTSVASFGAVFTHGAFYTGLTRDDVGGLRYMLRTNNMNYESVSADSTLIRTNTGVSQLLFTSNLTLLAEQSFTNDAGALTALFPGLVIASTTTVFTNVVITNAYSYFTNLPWSPAGSPATLVFATNYTTTVATRYYHTFANVVTNSFFTNGVLKLQTTTVGPCLLAPPGLICTNVTLKTVATNLISGDYYIFPTNSPCGIAIVRVQLTNVISITNEIVVATNAVGTTNLNSQQFSQSVISYFTNHVFVINPVECLTNSPALRQGMDRFKFVRANYDSLLGRFFQPITNLYTLVAISNSTPYRETYQRVINQPDLTIRAEERMVPDLAWLSVGFRTVPGRGNGYNVSNIQSPDNVDGPGTREPNIEILFNKVGPLQFNIGPSFLDEVSAFTNFVWASYDASTNLPVVYPSYRSLTDLENQILIQVNPTGPVTNGVIYLPNGTVGVSYAGVFSGFTATGGQPPYSWAIPPGSPGLPPNLILNANGTISGAPANGTAGLTFDFVIRMTDSGARSVDRHYAIKINP